MITAKFLIIPALICSILSCKQSTIPVLKMATTTSTDNTGLLDHIKPIITSDENIDLQWIAVGTGRALELGKNRDVDILLVHAPEAEKEFISNGYGKHRTEIMYNDFIIIGPENDPARIKKASVLSALAAISSLKAPFASRGDDSGTHKKELSLWKSAKLPVPDKKSWYIQAGQGMMQTIHIAAERNAYTLTDRGTYIKYESTIKGASPLIIIVEGDTALRNQYSVMAITPVKGENKQYQLAMRFIRWISSEKTQKFIGDFKLMGKQLFIPNAKKQNFFGKKKNI